MIKGMVGGVGQFRGRRGMGDCEDIISSRLSSYRHCDLCAAGRAVVGWALYMSDLEVYGVVKVAIWCAVLGALGGALLIRWAQFPLRRTTAVYVRQTGGGNS